MKAVDFEVTKVARGAVQNQLTFLTEMMRRKEASGHVVTEPCGIRALVPEARAAAEFQLRFFDEMTTKKKKG